MSTSNTETGTKYYSIKLNIKDPERKKLKKLLVEIWDERKITEGEEDIRNLPYFNDVIYSNVTDDSGYFHWEFPEELLEDIAQITKTISTDEIYFSFKIFNKKKGGFLRFIPIINRIFKPKLIVDTDKHDILIWKPYMTDIPIELLINFKQRTVAEKIKNLQSDKTGINGVFDTFEKLIHALGTSAKTIISDIDLKLGDISYITFNTLGNQFIEITEGIEAYVNENPESIQNIILDDSKRDELIKYISDPKYRSDLIKTHLDKIVSDVITELNEDPETRDLISGLKSIDELINNLKGKEIRTEIIVRFLVDKAISYLTTEDTRRIIEQWSKLINAFIEDNTLIEDLLKISFPLVIESRFRETIELLSKKITIIDIDKARESVINYIIEKKEEFNSLIIDEKDRLIKVVVELKKILNDVILRLFEFIGSKIEEIKAKIEEFLDQIKLVISKTVSFEFSLSTIIEFIQKKPEIFASLADSFTKQDWKTFKNSLFEIIDEIYKEIGIDQNIKEIVGYWSQLNEFIGDIGNFRFKIFDGIIKNVLEEVNDEYSRDENLIIIRNFVLTTIKSNSEIVNSLKKAVSEHDWDEIKRIFKSIITDIINSLIKSLGEEISNVWKKIQVELGEIGIIVLNQIELTLRDVYKEIDSAISKDIPLNILRELIVNTIKTNPVLINDLKDSIRLGNWKRIGEILKELVEQIIKRLDVTPQLDESAKGYIKQNIFEKIVSYRNILGITTQFDSDQVIEKSIDFLEQYNEIGIISKRRIESIFETNVEIVEKIINSFLKLDEINEDKFVSLFYNLAELNLDGGPGRLSNVTLKIKTGLSFKKLSELLAHLIDKKITNYQQDLGSSPKPDDDMWIKIKPEPSPEPGTGSDEIVVTNDIVDIPLSSKNLDILLSEKLDPELPIEKIWEIFLKNQIFAISFPTSLLEIVKILLDTKKITKKPIYLNQNKIINLLLNDIFWSIYIDEMPIREKIIRLKMEISSIESFNDNKLFDLALEDLKSIESTNINKYDSSCNVKGIKPYLKPRYFNSRLEEASLNDHRSNICEYIFNDETILSATKNNYPDLLNEFFNDTSTVIELENKNKMNKIEIERVINRSMQEKVLSKFDEMRKNFNCLLPIELYNISRLLGSLQFRAKLLLRENNQYNYSLKDIEEIVYLHEQLKFNNQQIALRSKNTNENDIQKIIDLFMSEDIVKQELSSVYGIPTNELDQILDFYRNNIEISEQKNEQEQIIKSGV